MQCNDLAYGLQLIGESLRLASISRTFAHRVLPFFALYRMCIVDGWILLRYLLLLHIVNRRRVLVLSRKISLPKIFILEQKFSAIVF